MGGKKFNHVKYIEKNCIRDIEYYKKVSLQRWDNVLKAYEHGEYFTALYIGGYCVECILKYVILKSLFGEQKNLELHKVKKTDWSKKKAIEIIFKHNIDKLMTLGNELRIFKVPKEVDFQDIIEWKSEWRYAIDHSIDKVLAKEFLESVILMSKQLYKEVKSDIKLKPFNSLPEVK
ncbi:hypothetical protein V7Y60_25095 [Priestia megaterium]|uniref:hypothetical protein n=1 Tax=Priestia megaterium TaxID=1404 RepID=UPI002FFE182A